MTLTITLRTKNPTSYIREFHSLVIWNYSHKLTWRVVWIQTQFLSNFLSKFKNPMHPKTSKLFEILDDVGFWQDGVGYKDMHGQGRNLVIFPHLKPLLKYI